MHDLIKEVAFHAAHETVSVGLDSPVAMTHPIHSILIIRRSTLIKFSVFHNIDALQSKNTLF
jgi:hypothetical protein